MDIESMHAADHTHECMLAYADYLKFTINCFLTWRQTLAEYV